MLKYQLAPLSKTLSQLVDLMGRGFAAYRTAMLAPLPQSVKLRLIGNSRPPIPWPLPPDQLEGLSKQEICLEGDQVFRTSISLPKDRRNSARQAIRLRMAEISPLSPDKIIFGLAEPNPDGETRIRVPIVIVRSSLIDEINEATGMRQVRIIAKSADGQSVGLSGGQTHAETISQAVTHPLVALAVLVMGAVLATQIWTDRRVDQNRELLREQITLLRAWEQEIAEAEALTVSHRLTPLGKIIPQWRSMLPEDGILSEADIDAGVFRLNGFMPEQARQPADASHGEFTQTPTRRPGWVKFSFLKRETETEE